MIALQQDALPHQDALDQQALFDHATLNMLRFAALGCRVKPQTDLFQACALLQVERSRSQAAHADALMRCLKEALGAAPRLFAPGTVEISFDEAWLMRLGAAITHDQDPSVAFLLRSRVLPEHRRLIWFLVGRIFQLEGLT